MNDEARNVLLVWWRDEKYEDYMGPPEGFVNELMEALDDAGLTIVRKQTMPELVNQIVSAINGWDETELKISFDDDGDGHLDFSRMKVTERGRADLMQVVEAAVKP